MWVDLTKKARVAVLHLALTELITLQQEEGFLGRLGSVPGLLPRDAEAAGPEEEEDPPAQYLLDEAGAVLLLPNSRSCNPHPHLFQAWEASFHLPWEEEGHEEDHQGPQAGGDAWPQPRVQEVQVRRIS